MKDSNVKTAVLGGSFDPVHLGHRRLALAAIEEAELDKLIIMPAKISPFKLDRKVTEDRHRLEMARLTFADITSVEISDYEIKNTEVSYTYNTLCALKEIYGTDKLYFVMGTDSMLTLRSWYRGEELIRNFSFIVSTRPGYRDIELMEAVSANRRDFGADITLIKSEMPDISSTEIRERVNAGESLLGLVTEDVEAYIRDNGLYRETFDVSEASSGTDR